jgi:hypothetical protein
MTSLFRLLKNSSHVIARSSFCDEAISHALILLKAGLPHFARNDKKRLFNSRSIRLCTISNSESASERIPRSLLRGLASEYDKEDFLAIRYLAALLRGSSLNLSDLVR